MKLLAFDVLSNENVVDHKSEGLLSGDTILGTVFGNRIVILPVVVDGLGDAWCPYLLNRRLSAVLAGLFRTAQKL